MAFYSGLSPKYFVSPSEKKRIDERKRRYLSRVIQSYDRLEHGEITPREFEELGFGKPYPERRVRKPHRY